MPRATIPTVHEYVDRIAASGLVSADLLKAAAKEFDARPRGSALDHVSFAKLLQEQGLITGWQLGHLLKGRTKGFFLGSYKLLDFLGSGGTSTVYLAEHTRMGRQVALKILAADASAASVKRFERECQAMAALDHAHIVCVHNFDSHGKLHYLAMEYVDGPDLQTYVDSVGPLSPGKAADCGRQAAGGLAYAHGLGIIHRDVKPANLLLNQDGAVKILDLGLARLEDSQECLTQFFDQKFLGTLDYVAPEQAVDSHNVDGFADVYGLGCSLYFLLTGESPYAGSSPAEKLLAHQIKETPDAAAKRPDAPRELTAFVRRMMAKSPDQRPSSAEAANQLARWRDEESPLSVLSRGPAARAPSLGIARNSSSSLSARFSLAHRKLAFLPVDRQARDAFAALRLGARLARDGKRVLFCDLNPDALNSSRLLGDFSETEENLKSFLTPSDSFPPPATTTTVDGLFLLTCPPGEERFFQSVSDARRLADGLRMIERYFDWIVIDLPPEQGPLLQLGLAAADDLVLSVDASSAGRPDAIKAIQSATQLLSRDHPPALGVAASSDQELSEETTAVPWQVAGETHNLFFSTTLPRSENPTTVSAGQSAQKLASEIIDRVAVSAFERGLVGLPWKLNWLSDEEQAARRERADVLAREYAAEKSAWEESEQQDGVVARDLRRVSRDGVSFSLCLWTEGTHALLPRADVIGFLRSNPCDLHAVSWEQAEKVLGAGLEPIQGTHPPRYSARQFPTAEQLESMTR
ncbi:MAG: protein kinase [Planctomycetales bacterium]